MNFLRRARPAPTPPPVKVVPYRCAWAGHSYTPALTNAGAPIWRCGECREQVAREQAAS